MGPRAPARRRFADVSPTAFAALDRVLGEVGQEEALALVAQAHRAVVAQETSARMIDLEIPLGVPRCGFRDGPLPVRTMDVREGNQLVGEFIVWVKGGWLAGIENVWFTDEPPTRWPKVEELIFQ